MPGHGNLIRIYRDDLCAGRLQEGIDPGQRFGPKCELHDPERLDQCASGDLGFVLEQEPLELGAFRLAQQYRKER